MTRNQYKDGLQERYVPNESWTEFWSTVALGLIVCGLFLGLMHFYPA